MKHILITTITAVVLIGSGKFQHVSYEMLEDIKLITFEPEISHLILLMCLTYCIGGILGNRRYQ